LNYSDKQRLIPQGAGYRGLTSKDRNEHYEAVVSIICTFNLICVIKQSIEEQIPEELIVESLIYLFDGILKIIKIQ